MRRTFDIDDVLSIEQINRRFGMLKAAKILTQRGKPSKKSSTTEASTAKASSSNLAIDVAEEDPEEYVVDEIIRQETIHDAMMALDPAASGGDEDDE